MTKHTTQNLPAGIVREVATWSCGIGQITGFYADTSTTFQMFTRKRDLLNAMGDMARWNEGRGA